MNAKIENLFDAVHFRYEPNSLKLDMTDFMNNLSGLLQNIHVTMLEPKAVEEVVDPDVENDVDPVVENYVDPVVGKDVKIEPDVAQPLVEEVVGKKVGQDIDEIIIQVEPDNEINFGIDLNYDKDHKFSYTEIKDFEKNYHTNTYTFTYEDTKKEITPDGDNQLDINTLFEQNALKFNHINITYTRDQNKITLQFITIGSRDNNVVDDQSNNGKNNDNPNPNIGENDFVNQDLLTPEKLEIGKVYQLVADDTQPTNGQESTLNGKIGIYTSINQNGVRTFKDMDEYIEDTGFSKIFIKNNYNIRYNQFNDQYVANRLSRMFVNVFNERDPNHTEGNYPNIFENEVDNQESLGHVQLQIGKVYQLVADPKKSLTEQESTLIGKIGIYAINEQNKHTFYEIVKFGENPPQIVTHDNDKIRYKQLNSKDTARILSNMLFGV